VDTEAQLSFRSMQGDKGMAHPREIERLVVALMAQAVDTEALVTESGVVLDLTIEGVRCLLIRCDEPPAFAILSPREREIARMVANGLTNKTIAHLLEISPWTVSTHLRRIFAKLRVTSRAAMVARLLTWKPGTQESPSADAFPASHEPCCDLSGASPGSRETSKTRTPGTGPQTASRGP
jgi:DNA-binding CsgD family transcriptional regulator